MLILDLSSVVFTASADILGKDVGVEVDDNMVRHVALNQILYYKNKFSNYGPPIIAVDARHYWRRDIFPLYKKNRKKARRKSNIDWARLFAVFNEFKEELHTYFSYPFIEVYGAEADDVMAVLARETDDDVCLVSSDKDMLQLQLDEPNNRIRQWSIATKKFITPKNKEYDFLMHLVKGDADDGVPNILSPEDVLVTEGTRQKQVRRPFLDSLRKADDIMSALPDDDARAKFKRNTTLIDLNSIPEQLRDEIVDTFIAELESGRKTRAFAYLKRHNLRNLRSQVSEF